MTANKIEISIDVIVHATEDISKIFQSFEESLEIRQDDFAIKETRGHYDNPIIMLNASIEKKQAQDFMARLLEFFSAKQTSRLVEEIKERTENSRFHLRLSKQELIKGNLVVEEKGTIKIKIHTPIYNKKETVKKFSEIFHCQLD